MTYNVGLLLPATIIRTTSNQLEETLELDIMGNCFSNKCFDNKPRYPSYPPQPRYSPEPHYSSEPPYSPDPHPPPSPQPMAPILSRAPIVHHFNTLPRHYTDLAEELDWNNDTVMIKGRDANRQPLMWDPSMGQDPNLRFHIRDTWF